MRPTKTCTPLFINFPFLLGWFFMFLVSLTNGDFAFPFIIFVQGGIVFLIISTLNLCTKFHIDDQCVQKEIRCLIFIRKVVWYKHIKEVYLKRGPIQKLLGRGTVEVVSHASNKDPGIKLFNIKEYQEVYKFLLKKTQP